MVHSHVANWLLDLSNQLPSVDPILAVSLSAILSIAFLTLDFFKNKK